MNEMKTVEDFKGNRIYNALLTDEEFAILDSIETKDLQRHTGFCSSGSVWGKIFSKPERKDYCIYRYNPESRG